MRRLLIKQTINKDIVSMSFSATASLNQVLTSAHAERVKRMDLNIENLSTLKVIESVIKNTVFNKSDTKENTKARSAFLKQKKLEFASRVSLSTILPEIPPRASKGQTVEEVDEVKQWTGLSSKFKTPELKFLVDEYKLEGKLKPISHLRKKALAKDDTITALRELNIIKGFRKGHASEMKTILTDTFMEYSNDLITGLINTSAKDDDTYSQISAATVKTYLSSDDFAKTRFFAATTKLDTFRKLRFTEDVVEGSSNLVVHVKNTLNEISKSEVFGQERSVRSSDEAKHLVSQLLTEFLDYMGVVLSHIHAGKTVSTVTPDNMRALICIL